jgi:PAS domain S-box-containing protein
MCNENDIDYKSLVELANCIIITADKSGKITYLNKFAQSYFGYTSDEIIGRYINLLLPPVESLSQRNLYRFAEKVLQNPDEFVENINENIKKSGELVWIAWRNSAIRDINGAVVGIHATGIDITKQIHIENELKESKEKYRKLFEYMTEEVHYWKLVFDTDGKIKTWTLEDANAPALKTWGKNRIEIIGKTTDEIFGPGSTDHYLHVVKKIFAENKPYCYVDYFPNLKKYFRFTTVPLGEYFITTGTDITDMKQSEQRILYSNRRFELLANTARELLNSDNPQNSINTICSEVLKLIDCQFFFNYVNDSEKSKLRLNAFSGISEEEGKRVEWLDPGVAVCGCVARDCKNIVVEYIQNKSDPMTNLVKSYGVRAYACYPLIADGDRLIGTLSFGTKNRDFFSDDELALIKAVADQVSVAMNRMQNEKLLRKSEERLKLALNSANAGIWDWNLLTNKNIWSEETWKLYGLIPDSMDASYENWLKTLHSDDREPLSLLVNKTAETGAELNAKWRVVLPDGSIRWLMSRGRPQYNKKGALVSYLGIVLDITELKKAEEELKSTKERIQSILESITDIYFVLDSSWHFNELNSQAELAFGKKRNEIIDKIYWDVFPDAVGGEFQKKLFVAMKERVLVHFEEFSYAMNKWIEGHIYPVDNGLECYMRDISDRKKLEKDLLKRANELAIANKELESFSYSISHDLRAPLRTMKSFSAILLEEYADRLDDEARGLFDRIGISADKMSNLIDDMLSLSRVSRQELKKSSVDMSKMANSIIRELQNTEPNRNVRVTISKDMTVFADAGLIQIALSNLLENAWKYSGKVNDAFIEFGKIERDQETVYFISDNGAGFDMKFADKLFTPFQRLHADSQFSGTGIGLAIVNRVILRHCGRIWAESNIGKGSTFYFTINHT